MKLVATVSSESKIVDVIRGEYESKKAMEQYLTENGYYVYLIKQEYMKNNLRYTIGTYDHEYERYASTKKEAIEIAKKYRPLWGAPVFVEKNRPNDKHDLVYTID